MLRLFSSLEEIIRTVDPDLSARDVKVMMAQVDTEGQPDVGFQQFMRYVAAANNAFSDCFFGAEQINALFVQSFANEKSSQQRAVTATRRTSIVKKQTTVVNFCNHFH